jgi:hypothetical protein
MSDLFKERAPEPPQEPTWIVNLRTSHDALLAAAKGVLLHGLPGLGQSWDHVAFEALRAAIAKSEELAP